MVDGSASLRTAPDWLRTYSRAEFRADLFASALVTVMLIPQSLAYALLAGLPPEAGLYASMFPAVAYACFGSSRVLAVGPVAVISLMTATALADVTSAYDIAWSAAAALLALLSGCFLFLLGLLRMGWIANFLSHAVISGFISASALFIAFGQLPQILGIDAAGDTLVTLLPALIAGADAVSPAVAWMGGGTIAFLVFARTRLAALLVRFGVNEDVARLAVRAGPVFAVCVGTAIVTALDLTAADVAVVGAVPSGWPTIVAPAFDWSALLALAPYAVLLSLVGFVESISVGQSLGMRRRQRVEPDRELLGLGAANVVAGVSGAFPVTGGFSRSVVNSDAGAASPLAGALTALGMGLVAAFFTPLFHDMPRAVLAAVIICAVLPLVDLSAMRRAWHHGRADFAALMLTGAGVLLFGVEAGIALGVLVSLGIHLGRSSRPHIAVVGRVPGTEQFRNVDRHAVLTADHVLCVRIDEALWFGNVRFLEERLTNLVASRPAVTELVLQCTAVNGVDGSAMEALERVSEQLAAAGVRLHLAEVKGPAMDALSRAGVPARLSGEIFFTQHEAMRALAGASGATVIDDASMQQWCGDGDGI